MIKQVIIYIVLLLGFIGFYIITTADFHSQDMVGQEAPLFQTQDIEDNAFDLSEQVGQKIILLNFWATWCPPCRSEIPVLNQIAKNFAQEDFLMVGISEDDAPNRKMLRQSILNFQKKIPMDFLVVTDSRGKIADLYGTYQLPESYLIDWQGKIAYKHYGMVTKWDQKGLEERLKSLLESSRQVSE